MEETVYFEFIQVAVGNRKSLSVAIDYGDWQRLFDFCKRQALLGVGFSAVEKLHAIGVECPSALRMKWMALALQIEKQNALLNEQCRRLTEQYRHDGLSTCILKGQGNLLNYPEEIKMRRCPGDIDVWAVPINDGGIAIAIQTEKSEVEYIEYHDSKAVIEYVKMQYRLMGISERPIQSYHHIDAPKMEGTEVEVHFRAAHLYSPLKNRRLQKWMNNQADVCMKNKTHFGFAMPTSSVNVIYQLTHMFKHHIDAGLGFRHLMDYYYALRVWYNDVMECRDLQTQGMWSEGLGTPVMSKEEVVAILRSFGMTKFTAAVMYVINKVFINENDNENENRFVLWMICEPNEKEGKRLLAEIMNSGNFGHYDSEKPNVYEHRLQYHIWKFKRILRLAMSYPEEAMWEPVFRGWRRICRMING